MKSDSCEKNHFLFSSQVKKMSLNQIAKNGPKSQFQQKWHFFNLTKKKQKQFFTKKSIFFSCHVKKVPFLIIVEFLAHFWQKGPEPIFWLD